MIALEITTNN